MLQYAKVELRALKQVINATAEMCRSTEVIKDYRKIIDVVNGSESVL